MTAKNLLEELTEELKEITKDLYFVDAENVKKLLTCYKQELPIQKDDDEDKQFPYIITKLIKGISSANNAESNEINVICIIGIKKDCLENNGHEDVLGIIQRTQERFLKNCALKHFYQTGDIKWAIESDAYPYFFGAIELTFRGMMVRKENEFI